jgi:hypothetical protein
MELSKFDRILPSLTALDEISWSGDVHGYQVGVMNAIHEVRACRANITHLILARIVKSFEGKSKTVQYKIAEIINSGVETDDTLNLYDIVQSICTDIATVGDTKKSVNSILDEVTCDFCGFKHKTTDCRKMQAAKESLVRGDTGAMPKSIVPRFKGNCSKCGRYGHKRKDCTAEDKFSVGNVSTGTEPAPLVEAQATPTVGQYSQDKLQEIMQRIASGEATVSLVKTRTVQQARARSGRLPPRLRPTRLVTTAAATVDDMPWSFDSSPAAAHDRSRDTAYGHRSDPHISETSHPGPDVTTAHSSSLLPQGQHFGEYKGNRVERIQL